MKATHKKWFTGTAIPDLNDGATLMQAALRAYKIGLADEAAGAKKKTGASVLSEVFLGYNIKYRVGHQSFLKTSYSKGRWQVRVNIYVDKAAKKAAATG